MEWRIWGSFGHILVYVLGSMQHIVRCFDMAKLRSTNIGGMIDDTDYDDLSSSSVLKGLEQSIRDWNVEIKITLEQMHSVAEVIGHVAKNDARMRLL